MEFTAYNVGLKRKEEIQDPYIEWIQKRNGTITYMLKGTGSNGATLTRFISKDDYDFLNAEDGEMVEENQ